MKKTYTKPEIVFENFSLSTSIAAGCHPATSTPNSGSCAYTYEDEFLGTVSVFVDGVSACTTKEADGEYNGFCYHVPTGENLFNS